jgi:cysteine desulfuration protein SufE
MTLEQEQQKLIGTLAERKDPQERLAWLVEEARRRPMMPASLRIDENRVEGCLARLWLVSEFREGRCYYQSESDSLIVKAIAGLLCELYSGHTPAEIVAHPPAFLTPLGITQHLTPNRRNGLSKMWTAIRQFAAAHGSPANPSPQPNANA